MVQGTLMRSTIHLVSPRDYWPFARRRRARRGARAWLRTAPRAGRPTRMAAAARTLRGRARRTAPLPRKEIEDAGRQGASRAASACGSTSSACRRPARGSAAGPTCSRAAADWVGPPPEARDRGRAPSTWCAATSRGVRPGAARRRRALDRRCDREVAPAARARSTLRRFAPRTATSCSTSRAPRCPTRTTPAPVRFLPTWDATLLVHARRTRILPEEHRPRIFNTRPAVGPDVPRRRRGRRHVAVRRTGEIDARAVRAPRPRDDAARSPRRPSGSPPSTRERVASRGPRRADLLEEAEHAPPRVLAGLRVLAERAVEERVRRARIDDDLVLDAGLLKAALVGLDVLGRDVLVGAAEEAEDRAARLGDVRRSAPAAPSRRGDEPA